MYDTADPDDPGLLAALTPGQPQIDENANLLGTVQSIGRFPNGSGAALDTSTYTTMIPTPGSTNLVPEPGTFSLVAGAFIAVLRRRRR